MNQGEDENVTGLRDIARETTRETASSLRTIARVESSLDRDVKKSEDDDDKDHKSLPMNKYYQFLWNLIWPDIILSNLTWPSLKIVLRSWLMMWSLTLLCIIDGPAEFMGPSSFLANFSCGIEISGNLSVSAAFVCCMSDLITVVFAFTISVVTMAINHRLHGSPSEMHILSELTSRGLCEGVPHNLEDCILPHVYKGHFLKTRTTVITIFGMLFSFGLCGYFQTKSKYGKLQWLLNSLFTIVVFTFNNMMPLWLPWYYARNVFKPMVMAFAARFAVSLFVLPFSSNKQLVLQLATACRKLSATAKKLNDPQSIATPSDPEFGTRYDFIRSETQATFTKHIVNEMDMEMVDRIEVALSCFERPDLSEMRSLVRLVMSALSSFHFFYEEIFDRKLDIMYGMRETVRKHVFKSDTIKEHTHLPTHFAKKLGKSYKETGAYEFSRKRDFQQNVKPFMPEVTLDELEAEFLNITKRYESLISSSADLLGCVADWLDASTSPLRTLSHARGESYHAMKASLKSLVSCMISCGLEEHVDENWALHGYVCLHFSRRVARLANWCLSMHNERPKPKPTWPFKHSSSRPINSYVEDLDYDGYRSIFGGAAPELSYAGFQPIFNVEARNPDSTPPRHWHHLLGRHFLKLYNVLYEPDFLFSIKRAGLIVVTLIPYFTRTTALLAYRHWFLWVAVLTSYTVAQQAVDGTYGLVAKFVFNFFGCLVGMVAWYISAGSGRGNPYGYAVVTAFVWLYIAFHRQFNKHYIPATSIVFSCTVTLVLGNSWSAGHIMLPGLDLGRGFSVAWMRFVTVSIGITVSFIGTLFPYPYTAKLAVREIIGNCLERLGDIQSSISNFGVKRFEDRNVHIVAHTDFITTAARAVITSLNSAETLRRRLVYEPPLAGVYPTHRYKLLIKYVLDIAQLYTLVYSFLDEIEDTANIPTVLRVMGWTNANLSTGLYSVIYMCCRALVDGKALPSLTSGHLAESYLYEVLQDDPALKDSQHVDPNLLSAIALSLQIYKRFDGVMILTKELVGEVYDVNMNIFELQELRSNSKL